MNESIYNDGPPRNESEKAARWREQSEVDTTERQTALLEQIRNGVSIVAVILTLMLLLTFIGVLAAGS